MDSVAMAMPVLPGKTEAARKIFLTVKNEKWEDYDHSQRKSGISRERDFLQSTPMGDMIIIYLESSDLNKAFSEFGASTDPFDVWMKEELKNVSGIDFSQPMSGPMPELLSSYDS
jgi:hypothetical protein